MSALPIRWSTALVDSPLGLVRPPVRIGDDILVRVNNEVFRLAVADGALRGRTIFDPKRSLGTFAVATAGAMVTDITADTAETGALVWIAIDGRVTRRLELHGQVADGSTAVDSAELDVCIHRPGAGNHLLEVDLAAGTIARTFKVPFGASSSVRLARGRLISNMAPLEDSAGLYQIDERGALRGRLVIPAVAKLVAAGQRVASATWERGGTHIAVEVRDRSSLRPLWSNPAAAAALAIDGADLAMVLGEGADFFPALVDVETGRPSWRAGAPATDRPVRAGIFGPVVVFQAGGIAVYRRADGELLAEYPDLYFAVLHSGDDLIVCNSDEVVCLSLSGL